MSISKIKRKPVELECIQYKGNNVVELSEWIGVSLSTSPRGLFIQTLEGSMKVSIGDYIIKGIQGEFYPCKPDIFEKIYEIIR